MTKDAERDRAADRIEQDAAERMTQGAPHAIVALLEAAERMRDSAALWRVGNALAAFAEAALDAGDAMARTASAVARHVAIATNPEYALEDRRSTFGGMSHEARYWPNDWQSTVCSAMLCSISSCPSDDHELHCTCPCHRRNR